MTISKDPILEGRLLALRDILCHIAAGDRGADLLAALETRVQDGQEDPGASAEDSVTGTAFAIEMAKADEERAFRRLLGVVLDARNG